MGDELEKQFDKGFGCLIGLIISAIFTIISFLFVGLVSVFTPRPPDVEKQLLEAKPQFANGDKIRLVTCPSCTVSNEAGQIECYACGASLYTTKTIQVASSGGSALAVQWVILAIMFFLSILLLNTNSAGSGNFMLGVLGLFLLIASIGLGIFLIHLTLS